MIVGEASVVIRAIGDKLESDIQKSLDRAGVRAGASGNKAGEKYSDGVTKAVEKNISKVDEPIREALSNAGERGGTEAGKKASEGLSKGLKSGSKDAEDLGERIGRRVGDRVSRGFERSRFVRVIGSALVKLGIFIPIIGALVGGISALVSGLYALVAALGTVSATSIALVGVLGAGVQGIGVFVVAMKGVGKAISEGLKPDNAEKFEEALKSIAPAARPFVREFVALKDEFKGLRNAAAEGLFPGLERTLNTVAPILPRLRDGFREAGDAAGDATDKFFKSITTADARENFAGISTTNNQVIRQFGTILGDLTGTVLALVDAAGPLTSRFTSWIERSTSSLRSLTEEGNNSGQLTKYFNDAGNVAALFGKVLGNVFEGLYDIGKIAQPVGVDLLRSFNSATDSFANFTDKAENVEKVQKYFDGVEDNVKAISVLVKELGGAFIRMGAAPGVEKTANALTKIVPDLEEALTKSIEEIGPAVVKLIGQILKLFSVLEESGAVKSVIDIFTALGKALVFVFNIPGIGAGLLKLLQFVAIMKALRLVMKGGGVLFNGVADSINSVTGASKRGIGSVSRLRNDISGLVAIKKDYGVRGLIEYTGVLEKAGTQSSRTRRIFSNLALTTASFADSVGRSVPGVARMTTGLTGVAAVAGRAATGIRRYVAANGRAAGSAALVGAAASGVADKVGLQNTALFASAGLMVGGPWGAAIGAASGYLVDLTSKTVTADKALQNFNKALDAGDASAMRDAIQGLEQELTNLQDSKEVKLFENPFDDLGTIVSQAFKGNFTTNQINGEINKTKDSIDEMKASYDRFKDALAISDTTNLKQSILDIKTLVDQMAEDGTKITLDFDTQQGLDLRRQFEGIASAAIKIGEGTPEFKEASNAIANIAKQAGLSGPAAQILANRMLGVKDALAGIKPDTEFKFTANDKEILAQFGLVGDEIDSLQNKVTKPLNFNIGTGGIDNLGTVRESLEAIQQRVKDLPADTPLNITLPNGETLKTTVDGLNQKINEFGQPKVANLTANTQDALGPLSDILVKRGQFTDKSAAMNAIVSGAVNPLNILLDKRASFKDKTAAMKALTALATNPLDILLNKRNDFKDKNATFKAKGEDSGATSLIDKLKSVDGNTFSARLNIGGFISGVSSKVRELLGFASGGWVSGPGTGTSDSIMATLSNGEFVVKAAQAKRYGPILEAMNSGRSMGSVVEPVGAPAPSAAGSSSLVMVEGMLTLVDGGAYIKGYARQEYDANVSYRNTVDGMGPEEDL